jgi:hypothetical protein
VTTLSDLADAHEFIGIRWSSGPSPDEKRTLELARDILDFIFATGQSYRFEDFSHHLQEGVEPPPQGLTGLTLRLKSAESFFERLLQSPTTAGEAARIHSILEAIRFVAVTNQYEALDAYLKHVASHGPPFVVASFETLREAEAWLQNHPHPPDPARILIDDRSHDVVHDRKTNIRRLPRNRDIHDYLVELKQVEPPVATASFATREEATAWLWEQPEPATHSWVSIAGELYLAAYYPNIGHRALYPLSMVEDAEASA